LSDCNGKCDTLLLKYLIAIICINWAEFRVIKKIIWFLYSSKSFYLGKTCKKYKYRFQLSDCDSGLFFVVTLLFTNLIGEVLEEFIIIDIVYYYTILSKSKGHRMCKS